MNIRFNYWKRILKSYLFSSKNQLTFWHDKPEFNNKSSLNNLGQYYMLFHQKADYSGFVDQNGVPLLNYHGDIGKKYNPIAISQWGLGNFNKWCDTNDKKYYEKFITCSNWLVENLTENKYGIKVWMHYFDFEYRDTLRSPWYSGLAQGQGISVLTRAFKLTKDDKYAEASKLAIKSFYHNIDEGGVNFIDSEGFHWIEEYIVNPPTHILNGFIWALWGLYDYNIYFKDHLVKKKFNLYMETLIKYLPSYDTGYWTLYEHSGTLLKMIASQFYHKLHIAQMDVMYFMTQDETFYDYKEKWSSYNENFIYNKIALIKKILFKVLYY